MTAHVKVSDTWQQIQNIYAKASGSWQTIQQGYVKVGGIWQQFYLAFTERTYEYNGGNTATGVGNHTLQIPEGCVGLWLTVYSNGGSGNNPQVVDTEIWGGDGGYSGARVQHRISIAPSDWNKTITFRIGSSADFEGTYVSSSGQGLTAGDFTISYFGGNHENLPPNPGEAAGQYDGSPGGTGGSGYDGLNNGGYGADGGSIFNQPGQGDPGTLRFTWKAP
jgi:hypothetical protein